MMWLALIPHPDRLDLRMAARRGAGHWRWVAPLLAIGAVAADIFLVKQGFAHSWVRVILPVLGLALLETMRQARPQHPWPRWRPRDGWLPWWRVSMWTLFTCSSFLIPVFMFADRIQPGWAPQALSGSEFLAALFPVCVMAPLAEEGVYRWLFCTGFAARMGPKLVIFFSGTIFAALHFVYYDNAAITNLLAGYLLAWVYFASGSLLMPVLWHSLGNLLLLLVPGLFTAS